MNVPKLVQWSEEYSVGISSIDAHHMKLFELLNALNEAMQVGKGKEMLGPIIKDLVNYTEYHFSKEEELMQKYQYPEYSNHKNEHTDFINKVKEFTHNLSDNKMFFSIELKGFLKDWILSHIKNVDKRYMSFLQSKGVR